jgi:hypothetical protein
VAEAIDRLDADRKSTDPAELAARVAAIWAMVAEIDPELARLVSRYATPADLGHVPHAPEAHRSTASSMSAGITGEDSRIGVKIRR